MTLDPTLFPAIPPELSDDPSTSASTRELLGRVLASIEHEVHRPPGWRDRLRRAPTRTRVLAAVGSLLAIVVLAVVLRAPRPDALVLPWWFYLSIGSLTVFAAAAVQQALLPIHQSVPRSGISLALLAAPVAFALTPGAWPDSRSLCTDIVLPGDVGPELLAALPGIDRLAAAPREPMDLSAMHFHCFQVALLSGLCAALVVLLFDRSVRPAHARLHAAAAAGGLIAFTVSQLTCPMVDATHLVAGHAPAGPLLALLLSGAALLSAHARGLFRG